MKILGNSIKDVVKKDVVKSTGNPEGVNFKYIKYGGEGAYVFCFFFVFQKITIVINFNYY